MSNSPSAPLPDILCIGAVLWDVIGRADAPLGLGADVPGRISRVPGGVALNIAATLARLGMRPALLSHIGRDAAGQDLMAACHRLGLVTGHIYRSSDLPTDLYMAIEGTNGLIAAIADAHSLEAADERILRPLLDGRLGSSKTPWPGLIALDGNLTAALLARIAGHPAFARADLRLAPASPGKAQRLAPLLAHPRATLYLNLAEAAVLCHSDLPDTAAAAAALLARGARRVLVTDGSNPVAEGSAAGLLVRTPPAVSVTRITGAGDTFLAAHIAADRAGANPSQALDIALRAAAAYVSGGSS